MILQVLMMGDAHDSLILCNASELMARRRRLAPLSAVVVGEEPIFWPGRARYGGVALAEQYPNALGGSPLKYVNAGTQVGSPAALLAASSGACEPRGSRSSSWRLVHLLACPDKRPRLPKPRAST